MKNTLISLATHTVAFIAGAAVIVTLLSAALSRAIEVHIPQGEFFCLRK